MNRFTRYFAGVGEEARRIRWPSMKELWKSVAIVLVITIVAALFIYLSDFLAVEIMRAFELAFPNSGGSDSETDEEAAEAIRYVYEMIRGAL